MIKLDDQLVWITADRPRNLAAASGNPLVAGEAPATGATGASGISSAPVLLLVLDEVLAVELLGRVPYAHPELRGAGTALGRLGEDRFPGRGDTELADRPSVHFGEPDAHRRRRRCGQVVVEQLPDEEFVAVDVLLGAERGEVVLDAQDLAVVRDADQEGSALGVEEAAHRLDQDLPEPRIVLLGVDVPPSAGLELRGLRLARGDEVTDG